MLKLITTLALFVATVVSGQTSFEKDMSKAVHFWNEGKSSEALTALDKITMNEKENWLPYYYIALIHTVDAYENSSDKIKMKTSLEQAQKAQDKANALALENPEVLVVQAMIHTAWIVFDPMINGQKLSGDVLYILNKAYKIAPENPRVVFQKADFEKGMAAYFGQDTAAMCVEFEKAIKLFATFKPETPLHPNWGLDRAEEALKQCK